MMTIGLGQLLEEMPNAGAQDLSVTTGMHIGRVHVGIINVSISPLRELVRVAH